MSSPPIIPRNIPVLIGLGIVTLFLLIYQLDYLPLKFEEPRRALVALEMLISGNFWAPTINGEFYYNKPPLFNWILAGFFRLFGFSNWVERLPTLLSIIGIALTNFFFFREKIGKEVSAMSSIFYVLSGHMLFYFSFQGEIDIAYSFVVYLQVICVFHFFERKKWRPLFLFSYGLMSIGFLMKGLPSIAFQALTLVGIFLWHKEYKKLFHAFHFIGILLSLTLLTGYFYIYSGYNDPEVLIAKLTVESARRTGDGGSFFNYLIQLVKFPLTLIKIMLPGCLIVLVAGHESWKNLLKNKWVKYSIIFIIFNLPLYWISPGTRDRYVYMFLPFIYNILFFAGLKTVLKSTRGIENFLFWIIGVIGAFLILIPFFREEISLTWSAVSVIILIAIGLLVKRKLAHALFGFALFMMTLRFYYNQVIFPIRAESEHNIAATMHAEKVYQLTTGSSLSFYGTREETTLKIPFRQPVVIQEIERLPYQFSYYYSSKSESIIHWTDKVPESKYYITGEENIKSQNVRYSFEMEGRRFVLIEN